MTSEAYASRVIALYLGLPCVSGRAGRADWALARALQAENIAIEVVEAAMWLAVARRSGRDPEARPLAPIRSLAYFRPVIEELSEQPSLSSYIDYLRDIGSALPRPSPASVRKPALLRDR